MFALEQRPTLSVCEFKCHGHAKFSSFLICISTQTKLIARSDIEHSRLPSNGADDFHQLTRWNQAGAHFKRRRPPNGTKAIRSDGTQLCLSVFLVRLRFFLTHKLRVLSLSWPRTVKEEEDAEDAERCDDLISAPSLVTCRLFQIPVFNSLARELSD